MERIEKTVFLSHRPRQAEYHYERFQFLQGNLQEAQLVEAERLAKLGKDRTLIRYGHLLCGQ